MPSAMMPLQEKTPLLPDSSTEDPHEAQSQRRHRCRRLVLVRVYTLLAVALFWFYILPAVQRSGTRPARPVDANPASQANLCLTPACVHASSEILYNLSPNYKNIDPCTDFEELVCGGWKGRHDLRPDQGDAFTGTIMAENSQLLLRHILEAPYPEASNHSYFSPMQLAVSGHSADRHNFDKMKAVYDACVDETTIKHLGVAPLAHVVSQVTDAFPLTSTQDSVKDVILLLAKQGIPALVTSGTGADDTDPDTVIVAVSPPWNIGLPSKERYEDDKLVQKYQDVIVKVLSQLVPDQDKDSFAKVVDLEKKLAAASPNTEEREDVTKYYNPMSLDEAAGLVPQINLTAILSGLAPAAVPVTRVIVTSPKYMKSLSTILKESPREVLQNYFIWKVVQSLASYVEADAVKPYQRFVNELAGKDPDSEPERWRRCVDHVDNGVGWILSRFFVEKAFSAQAKNFGDLVVSDIKEQFTKKLEATEWMDKDTTAKAIEKVHNIVQKIGYPTESPNIMDPDSVRSFYETVNVTNSTYFANELSLRSFSVAYEWSALGKPVDRNQWGMTVPTVNAYYNPPGNEIVFPAGIMQFPVFDVDVPSYISYGAFGSVAGHELSHAFDSTGRHYDQNGNYTDWWSESTVEAFKDRAECFVEQYSNYTVPGPDEKPLHVNGRLTLGENIADAGGLSASFQAWTLRAAEKPNEDLPGLEFFTQQQLFFVAYGNWWCGKSRRDTAIDRIYTDPHAPKWARILGTMANSREFRENFQCKDRNPTCELW